MFIKARGDRQNFVELFPQGQLPLEFLAFFRFQSFDGNLVALGEVEDDIRE